MILNGSCRSAGLRKSLLEKYIKGRIVTSLVVNVTDVCRNRQRSQRHLHDTARLRCSRLRQNHDWRHVRATNPNPTSLRVSVKWLI